jgi:glycosyltransferase involved in cell wall biosynthesis
MRFPKAANPLVHGILVAQERLSIAMCSAAITVNAALGERLLDAGVPASRVHVVPNSPSLTRFDPAAYPARPFMADGTLRLVYTGALSTVYEVDVVLQALLRVRDRRPALPVTLDLYGRDFAEIPLRDRAAELGLADVTTFHGRIPIEDVPAAVAAADIGLAPTRRTEFTDFSLSTKIFEYAAMGKPVIASRLPMVERTFGTESVVMYTPGDPDDLCLAMLSIVDAPGERAARIAAASGIVRDLAWEVESRRYVALIEGLAADGLPG